MPLPAQATPLASLGLEHAAAKQLFCVQSFRSSQRPAPAGPISYIIVQADAEPVAGIGSGAVTDSVTGAGDASSLAGISACSGRAVVLRTVIEIVAKTCAGRSIGSIVVQANTKPIAGISRGAITDAVARASDAASLVGIGAYRGQAIVLGAVVQVVAKTCAGRSVGSIIVQAHTKPVAGISRGAITDAVAGAGDASSLAGISACSGRAVVLRAVIEIVTEAHTCGPISYIIVQADAEPVARISGCAWTNAVTDTRRACRLEYIHDSACARSVAKLRNIAVCDCGTTDRCSGLELASRRATVAGSQVSIITKFSPFTNTVATDRAVIRDAVAIDVGAKGRGRQIQRRHSAAGSRVSYDQIGLSVTIKIARRHIQRSCTDRHVKCRGERSIAVVRNYRNTGRTKRASRARVIENHKICVQVAIYIRCGQEKRRSTHGNRAVKRKVPGPVIHKNLHSAVSTSDYGQIKIAVGIQINGFN